MAESSRGATSPIRSKANFSSSGSLPVGSRSCAECANGLADMSGNALEWTRSLMKNYPYVASDGREDMKASGRRMVRGGFFGNFEGGVRAVYRDDLNQDFRSGYVGFRVVVSRS